MDKWRPPTEEEAKITGGLWVPNEEHPEVKAEIHKMAQSIYEKIDFELLAKFNRETETNP